VDTGVGWHYVEARDAAASLPRRLLAVWRHRRLLQLMAMRDLRQRYVGSTLGLAWAVLSPLLFVAVYVAIFTFVFGGRLSPGAPTAEYALYVVSGLLPWVAFSEVAARATQTMGEHRSLVKFVVFPVQILPLCSLFVTTLSQGLGLAVLLVMAVVVQGGLPPMLWLLLPTLLAQAVFLAGAAWLLGALGAILRDVKELVQVALMVGMFLTPIFYLERDLPAPLRLVLELNPLVHLLRLYRTAFLGAGLEHPVSALAFVVIAAGTLLLGFVTFDRTRSLLSDIL
jgi:lipopolysaccharide transport system permease protein